jgi:hypothetical protein
MKRDTRWEDDVSEGFNPNSSPWVFCANYDRAKVQLNNYAPIRC